MQPFPFYRAIPTRLPRPSEYLFFSFRKIYRHADLAAERRAKTSISRKAYAARR